MKKLMMLGVAGVALASLAAVNDTLISFSTPGTDTYIDGTAVQDGECYALVWSADGVFEGIKADGTAIDANDRVVLVAPVAKDGKCPDLVYQVDAAKAKEMEGGQYGVYLLDTRRVVAGETKVGLNPETGKLDYVKSYATATDAIAAADGIASAAATKAVDGAAVAAYVEVPKPMVAIEVKNATIKLTVTGMSPVADYWIEKGTEIQKVSEKVADVPADGVVEVEKTGAAAFFQVKGGIKQ
ncbi:MAG: hypothetical protein Q4G65_06010 [bacterium]|nr:hypothetical protein [bacterium]